MTKNGQGIFYLLPAGSIFNNWDWLKTEYSTWGDVSTTDQQQLWIALSKKYVEEATGEVTAVQKYKGYIWTNFEKPILESNGVKINIIGGVILEMHSNTYNDFIKQINSTEYQKAQGYNPNLLEKIYANERDEVENIILKLFKNGDHQCIIFLPQLTKVDGISLLKDELLKWSAPNIVNAEIAHILWKVTKSASYEDLLVEDLKIRNSAYRSVIVRYLLECKPSQRLYHIFENLCQNDSDKLVRYNAAIGLLFCAGFLKDPLHIEYQHPLRNLISRLSGDSEEEREKAKKELDELISKNDKESFNNTLYTKEHIAKQIADRHNAVLTVNSKKGEKTEFVFQFTRRQVILCYL